MKIVCGCNTHSVPYTFSIQGLGDVNVTSVTDVKNDVTPTLGRYRRGVDIVIQERGRHSDTGDGQIQKI